MTAFYKEWKRKIIKWLLAQFGVEERYITAIIDDIKRQDAVEQAIDSYVTLMERYRPSYTPPARQRQRTLRRGYVYFVFDRSRDAIKIGFSQNPEKRLSALQVSNLQPLKLVATIEGTIQSERLLHDRFAEHRISGEWFHLSDDLRTFIKDIRKQGRWVGHAGGG